MDRVHTQNQVKVARLGNGFTTALKALLAHPMVGKKTLSWSAFLLFSLLSVWTTLAHAQRNTDVDFSAKEQRWIVNNPQVTVAFQGYYPPYSFLNDDQKLEGLAIDVFNLLAHKTNLTFNIYPKHKWNQILADAKQKKIDIVATMVEKPERLEWFNFSQAYIFKSQVIVTREEDMSITSKSDIAHKKVALVRGFHYVKEVIEEHPSITPVYFDTIHETLNAVSVGDADAAIAFFGASHFLRQKYLLTHLKYAAIYDNNNSNESIAISNDKPLLTTIIGKALASIPEAQLQKLRAKWLPVDDMEELTEITLTDKEREWIKNHPHIRLGVDPEYAPFEYIEQQQYKGIAADYIKLLNQRLSLNMEVTKNLNWSEAIRGIKSQTIDALPVVSITPLRSKFLAFSKPYLNFHRVIVTRDDIPFVSGLNDLQNLRVSAQPNTSHHEFLIENSNIKPVLYTDLKQSLLAVSAGKADAYIGNVASVTYWIRKLNLTNVKIAAPASTETQKLRFAVRKDWPELVTILDKGLNSISPRQRKIISEKWLSIDYNPSINYHLLWQTVAFFSLLVISIILWNIQLNRKVKLRTIQLAYSSNYDKLTKLPNRFLILDRLDQKINETENTKYQIAVLSIDINNFKMINNVHGHNLGDQILSEFAKRLKNSLRRNQHVGRISGNQFLMIQSHIEDSIDSASLAEQVIACTTSAFSSPLNAVELSTSLGMTLYPSDGNNAELLLKNADTATQYAKKQANGGYTYYSEHLNKGVSRNLSIEKNLRRALARNELEVYFQPKISSTSNNIESFEALLRWNNKELGEVPPTEFIPVAEKSDHINSIGLFVIRESLHALEQWQQKYQVDFSVAINLSPVQFQSEDLLPNIESILKQYAIASSSVEFEITEGVLLTDYSNIEENLRALESMGVSLAMDDFGTGYSSLSYLRKYHFNTLKIDREFITELPHSDADKKLVSAIIAMAHELRMEVVAEGVETPAQHTFLIEQGCDYLQGWLYSKALTFSDINLLLDQQYAVKTLNSVARE